jgi:hypothetical protein
MARIDTGDFVVQKSTNEIFMVAIPAQAEDPYLSIVHHYNFFPEMLIPSSDCLLHAKATPVARLQTLYALAYIRDNRGAYARRELSKPTEVAE